MAVVDFAREPQQDDLDDLDALFADKSLEEVLRNQDEQDAREKLKSGKGSGRGLDAGVVDEDIKITKKRAPNAKLDEIRLLSANGVPRIRKIAKSKLKFKGKGHEFSDVAMLLRVYQLWLDDLYPKAKFADALSMIEKLGHTKTMQQHRKQWLDEGKYGVRAETVPDEVERSLFAENELNSEAQQRQTLRDGEACRDSNGIDTSDTSTTTNRMFSIKVAPLTQFESPPADNQPDVDELDALLADHEENNQRDSGSIFGNGPSTKPAINRESKVDEYADDEEALRDMDLDPPW